MKKQISALLLLCAFPILSMDNMNNNVFGLPFMQRDRNDAPNNDQMILQLLTGRAKRQLNLELPILERPKKTPLPPRKSKKKRIY